MSDCVNYLLFVVCVAQISFLAGSPGEYRLSAFAAAPENAPELSPPYVDLTVSNPVLNAIFYQAQVSVHGSVVCKEKCGSHVSVSLVRLSGKGEKEKMRSSLTEQSSFMFSNVLPGKYRVEVRNSPEAAFREDKWCWEQSFIDFDVGTEDVGGIVFVQKGYWVNVISSHDIDAFLTQTNGPQTDLKIKRGSQNICVESPGVHELHFVNSCIYFGSSFVTIDTSDSSPVTLKGEKYLVRGCIQVESNSFKDTEELPENVVLDILNTEGVVIDTTIAKLVGDGNEQLDAVYEYSIWADAGEKFTFVPRDSRYDDC